MFKPLTGFQKITPQLKTRKESDNPLIQLSTDLIRELGGTYGFYMKILKLAGEQNVRCWLSDSQQSAIPKKRFLWLWKSWFNKIKCDKYEN